MREKKETLFRTRTSSLTIRYAVRFKKLFSPTSTGHYYRCVGSSPDKKKIMVEIPYRWTRWDKKTIFRYTYCIATHVTRVEGEKRRWSSTVYSYYVSDFFFVIFLSLHLWISVFRKIKMYGNFLFVFVSSSPLLCSQPNQMFEENNRVPVVASQWRTCVRVLLRVYREPCPHGCPDAIRRRRDMCVALWVQGATPHMSLPSVKTFMTIGLVLVVRSCSWTEICFAATSTFEIVCRVQVHISILFDLFST